MIRNQEFAPNVGSIDVPVQGSLMRRRNERFENLPEDIRVIKAGEDAGFIRKVSRGHYFVTVHDIELTGLGFAGSCREFTSPRDDEKIPAERKDSRRYKNSPSIGSRSFASLVPIWH